MKTRHEKPIPKGKQPCYQCEGWGVTHYSAEEIGKAVTCSVCDGEGLRDLPPEPFYKSVEEEFDEWAAEQGISPNSLEAHYAELAWNAAAERYGDGD